MQWNLGVLLWTSHVRHFSLAAYQPLSRLPASAEISTALASCKGIRFFLRLCPSQDRTFFTVLWLLVLTFTAKTFLTPCYPKFIFALLVFNQTSGVPQINLPSMVPGMKLPKSKFIILGTDWVVFLGKLPFQDQKRELRVRPDGFLVWSIGVQFMFFSKAYE